MVVCCDVTVIWRRMEPRRVQGREGTERCLVLYGFEIWAILCVIVDKINNMFLCKNHVNMCLRDVLTWKL